MHEIAPRTSTAAELLALIREEVASVAEDLGAERAKVETFVASREADMAAAIQRQDWTTLQTSVDTIGVELVRAGITLRGMESDRAAGFLTRLLTALLNFGLGQLAALVLALWLTTGCAALHRGDVPTSGPVQASVDDVCDFLDECRDGGHIDARPLGCYDSVEGTLSYKLMHGKWIDGAMMEWQIGAICDDVALCVDRWKGLPPDKARTYQIACVKLEETAAVAAGGS